MGKGKTKNKKSKSKRILNTLSSIFKKHWYIYIIITSIPTAWFSAILPYAGTYLNLINEDNSLTFLGIVLTIIVMFFIAIIVFLHDSILKYREDDDIDAIKGKRDFLQEIIKNVDKICDEKLSTIRNRIIGEKEYNKEKVTIISNPKNQLRRIIDGMTECLVNLLNSEDTPLKFGDFLITIAYSFPQEGTNWQWTDDSKEKDMELEDLLNPNCLSTFNYILKTNNPYYFNNSKETAKANGQYAYTPLDELSANSKEIVGSIFCYRYRIKKRNTTYIDAMLSITTQKKRFSQNDDEESCTNVCENMVSIVKDYFGKRIGIELSLLYLEYLKNQDLLNRSNSNDQQPDITKGTN